MAEVVALFEKMEALFSFMSGLAPLEKREENLDLPVLLPSYARKCVKMKRWKDLKDIG